MITAQLSRFGQHRLAAILAGPVPMGGEVVEAVGDPQRRPESPAEAQCPLERRLGQRREAVGAFDDLLKR